MKLADEIRDHVFTFYMWPLRVQSPNRKSLVTIRSGDVIDQLKLKDRAPAVCGALDALKFGSGYQVQLIARTGPKQGRTATWQFLV